MGARTGAGGVQRIASPRFWLHRPPTPTRSPPCRGMRFASPWRRSAPGFALRARAAACYLGCPVSNRLPLTLTLSSMSPCGGVRKKARYGAESTSQVPICMTAATPDWRARRGEACVVEALKCIRPHLQADPFDAAPYRAFFRAPLTRPKTVRPAAAPPGRAVRTLPFFVRPSFAVLRCL